MIECLTCVCVAEEQLICRTIALHKPTVLGDVQVIDDAETRQQIGGEWDGVENETERKGVVRTCGKE
jgi:hypothetical protein